DFERLTRHVFASSSCGLCGKATVDAIRTLFPPVTSTLTVQAQTLAALPDVMRQAQATFARTGGLHAAAVFDAKGQLLVLREDVGRHNAVDKVLGHALLNDQLPLDQHVLLVSGRTSFEILQKSLAAGIAVVAAVSAPSSLPGSFPCPRPTAPPRSPSAPPPSAPPPPAPVLSSPAVASPRPAPPPHPLALGTPPPAPRPPSRGRRTHTAPPSSPWLPRSR